MKHAVKLLATGSAIAMAMTAAASAADLAEPRIIETPVFEAPERVPAAVSGWYIRGDVGYSWNKFGGATYITNGTGGTNTLDGDLKSSFSVGGGIGYQLNHFMRVDLTGDYQFKTDFEGSTTGTCTTAGVGGVAAACTSADIASYSAWTVLANAYFDLGTYAGITPYVGAGIGGAYVHWSDLENTIPAGFVQSGTTTHEGSSDWRFAYALMVGASYDINHKTSIDLGYRFKKISGGHMFGYANGTGPGYDDGISSHEIRAGLRYKFGGKSHKTSYHPTPVYK